MSFDQANDRRRFLQFLASSPLFAAGGLTAFANEGPTAPTRLLRIELRAIMQQVGAPNLKALVPNMVRRA